ncbi:MAG: indole-3-glycerol phosphate synthase TrpC [candidate division Zixibacteria bacterium]|nr:indole-3-glycerol phosphate synthase TrpC [candidate division Zixibacteria bacterium]
MNILYRIVAQKRREVEDAMRRNPDPQGQDRTPARPFAQALRRSDDIAVIAEYKRASPSKGVIRADMGPCEVADIYAGHGASALSVLTDEHFFQGQAAYLTAIHERVQIPVLRKDFIIDPYQIREAWGMGADAVLLIAAILSRDQLVSFQQIAKTYGMACLVEAHTEAELDKALEADTHLVGINNRNLEDFSVDLDTSLRLKRRIPDAVVAVSESGIHTREDARKLRDAGFDAVLVGESLMAAPDIGKKLDEILGKFEV